MLCPACGYELDPFTTTCPRCAHLAARQAAQTAVPAGASTGQTAPADPDHLPLDPTVRSLVRLGRLSLCFGIALGLLCAIRPDTWWKWALIGLVLLLSILMIFLVPIDLSYSSNPDGGVVIIYLLLIPFALISRHTDRFLRFLAGCGLGSEKSVPVYLLVNGAAAFTLTLLCYKLVAFLFQKYPWIFTTH